MSQLRKVRIEMTGRANMIATAIAFVAVAIAAAQWWNTRQQLVLNLFEKRFQVFLDVRKIASEALQNGRIDSTGLINEILARGRFLFGPELVEELKRLYPSSVNWRQRQRRKSKRPQQSRFGSNSKK